MDPETDKQIERCPFLRKEVRNDSEQIFYTCDIYYDRPEDCRVYPTTVADMIKDECEMLEPRDLVNLKQAQRELKQIMVVSE